MKGSKISFLDIRTGERKDITKLLGRKTAWDGITIGTEEDNDIVVKNVGDRDIRNYHARIYFPNGKGGKPALKPNEAPVYIEESENQILERLPTGPRSGREINFNQVFYLGQNGFGFVLEKD
jgi:hypothetical protein